MPDAWATPGGEGDGSAGEERRGAGSGPVPHGQRRSPGWGEVVTLAAIILGLVFALEIASRLVPAIGNAFAGLPVTVAVLVAGTIGVLVLVARRGAGGGD